MLSLVAYDDHGKKHCRRASQSRRYEQRFFGYAPPVPFCGGFIVYRHNYGDNAYSRKIRKKYFHVSAPFNEYGNHTTVLRKNQSPPLANRGEICYNVFINN